MPLALEVQLLEQVLDARQHRGLRGLARGAARKAANEKKEQKGKTPQFDKHVPVRSSS